MFSYSNYSAKKKKKRKDKKKERKKKERKGKGKEGKRKILILETPGVRERRNRVERILQFRQATTFLPGEEKEQEKEEEACLRKVFRKCYWSHLLINKKKSSRNLKT